MAGLVLMAFVVQIDFYKYLIVDCVCTLEFTMPLLRSLVKKLHVPHAPTVTKLHVPHRPL